jgi:hypothetical protein
VAVVGDARWAAPTRVADTFLAEPVRFFDLGDTAQAENWLRMQSTGKRSC